MAQSFVSEEFGHGSTRQFPLLHVAPAGVTWWYSAGGCTHIPHSSAGVSDRLAQLGPPFPRSLRASLMVSAADLSGFLHGSSEYPETNKEAQHQMQR